MKALGTLLDWLASRFFSPSTISIVSTPESKPSVNMKWIEFDKEKPPADGEYWVWYAKSLHKAGVGEWYGHQQAWGHDLVKKSRRNPFPKTWVTHWANIEGPNVAI